MKGLPADFSWEDLLAAAAVFQQLVPESVLVGGSAAALVAGHRVSRDIDFTLGDLPARFDELLAILESREDWTSARVQKPVLILGAFRNVETGLRKLRRAAPLETTFVDTGFGRLRVPTPEEILRVKAWLVLARNQTRDYLDVVALDDKIGRPCSIKAMRRFDQFYADLYKPGAKRDVSPLLQLARQLADPQPEDADWMELSAYKALQPPWTEWPRVREAAAGLAADLASDRLAP